MNRYHKKIYFPHTEKLKAFNDSLNIKHWGYSTHSLDRIKEQINFNEIENILNDIKTTLLDEQDIFEYYEVNGVIEKACYRIETGEHLHSIIVISKDKNLITVYMNGADDNHITLDKSLYKGA